MPKTGLTSTQWKQRLKSYARGGYSFGRGQKPWRDSQWARKLAKIDICPRHRGAVLDVFGLPVECRCGYHSTEETTASHISVTRQQSMTERTAASHLPSSVAEGTARSPLPSSSVTMTVAEGTARSPLPRSDASPFSTSVAGQQSTASTTREKWSYW